MKVKKKIFSKLLISFVLSMLVAIIYHDVHAYQITNYVKTKEQLGATQADFPTMVYRKQTAAYGPTIEKYNKGVWEKKEHGWVYDVNAKDDTIGDPSNTSFVRDYEYFHKNINSVYNTSGTNDKKYSTGKLESTVAPNIGYVGTGYVSNVEMETSNYTGVFWGPSKRDANAWPIVKTGVNPPILDTTKIGSIVLIDSNLYRFAIKNGVYISDNELSDETIKKVFEKFATPEVYNAKQLKVYQSSVLRTKHNYVNSKPFFENFMDTSYKFFETTLRGDYGDNWKWSSTINGGSRGEDSVINYYDNTFIFPIYGSTKKVYVRHVDVTGMKNYTDVNSIGNDKVMTGLSNTQLIEVTKDVRTDNKYVFSQYRSPVARNRVYDTIWVPYSSQKYSEKYELANGDKNWIVGNIKYTHDSAYLNSSGQAVPVASLKQPVNEIEKDIINNYECVGYRIGKGNTLEDALENRKENAINPNGGNWCHLGVYGGEENDYIVIDFYYEKTGGEGGRDGKEVYVRHIDLTNQQNQKINYTNVEKAIAQGNVLPGKGIASYNGGTIDSTTPPLKGYQEYYNISVNKSLTVFKDETEGFECIGTNITSSNVSVYDARNNMDEILDNGYSSPAASSKSTYGVSGNYILIDFYYKSTYTGTPIERKTKGRLGFYTLRDVNSTLLSGDSSTNTNINNRTTEDDGNVLDIIPSGESMRVSIDNAPTYMLGGINISETKVKGTFTFDYTVNQPYKVNYLDWSSSCSGPCDGTESDKRTGYCGDTYWYWTTCDSICGEGENAHPCSVPCQKSATCGGTWTAWTNPTSTTDTISRTYRYSVPFEYTFYKVKNMRLYTISKMELHDEYENNGLPLFDGNMHTFNPVGNYIKSFEESSSDFVKSTSAQTVNRNKVSNKYAYNSITYSHTMNQLEYKYNNQDGDITITTAKTFAEPNIQSFFNNAVTNHSIVAKMKNFNTTEKTLEGGHTERTLNKIDNFSNSSDQLTAVFYVKNDEVKFKDQVSGNNVRIVGGAFNTNPDVKETAVSSGNKSNEMNAIRFENLATYTSGKTRNGTTNNYTYNVDASTETINISTQYPKSIRTTSEPATGSKYLPISSDSLTDSRYFEEADTSGSKLKIPEDTLNGKRYSYGKIYYNVLQNNKDLNFDSTAVKECTESNKSSCHDWNNDSRRIKVDGRGKTTFEDTEMYNTAGSNQPEKTTLISPSSLGQIVWEYGKNNNTTTNKADVVDVFTPVALRTWVVTGQTDEENKQVDHTTENKNDEAVQLQKNSRFTIAMEPTNQNGEYYSLDTDKYLMQYYIKFDFDVQDIKIYDAMQNGRDYNVGFVAAGDWIGPIYNHYLGNNLDGEAKISAFALADPNAATINSVVNQEQNEYTVRAVAYNTPNGLLYDLVTRNIAQFVDKDANKFFYSKGKTHQQYYDQKNIEDHNNYIAETTIKTENLSRVYDFKITDLKDLDWKNIFRKSTTTTTNVHTNKAYYSGIKKWNVYTTLSNQLLTRDASEIGATKQQILPLGPYKNTNTTYIKAPKLGYKFSFDLKTTGAEANKKVIITPSFYYISKDSDPSDSSSPKIEKNIDLYYKNSSNKYVKIDNYNIYFVPDDGYRLTFEGTDAAYRFSGSNLSKSTIKLGTTKKLTLTSKMMQQADNMFVQLWYGEYKLPNSTIAVKAGDDINNRLTNGYIGVKFDIEVIEYNSSNMIDSNVQRRLNYNQKDKKASGNNTTQWDYEGYLGYDYTKKKGANVDDNDNIRIQLEKMTWELDQNDYDFVKGTVILYDIDAKASSDYN